MAGAEDRPARRRFWRRALVLLALTSAGTAASLGTDGVIGNLDGPLYDLALGSTARISPPVKTQAPVVIVALDHRSLDSNELRDIPRVLMAPVWGTLIDGLADAKARAVGFDFIFSFVAGRFKPGYDRTFLAALARHRALVVLGRSLRTPLALPYFFAVGANQTPGSVGYVEMMPDSDGVFRTARAALRLANGSAAPTLAGALAQRSGGPITKGPVRIAPRQKLEETPTYALVDVLRCIAHDPAAVASRFRDRIVLIGSTLPEEDRKIGPDRFLPARPSSAPPGDSGAGCHLDRLGPSDPDGGTVAGTALEAGAIRALMGLDAAHEAPAIERVPSAATASLVAGGAGFVLAPWAAVAATVVILAGLFAVEAVLLLGGVWVPMAVPMLCAIAAVAAAYLVRFLLEERRRRRIQYAFGHYLAPTVVEALVNSERSLRLGGELRDITVMFADLSGFTALSGTVGPERLMELTNRYLAIIAAAVDETGGYVDKFIGDAVMAIWGAPLAEDDHAARAAGAALAIADRIERARADDRARGERGFSVKIGLNVGLATVGNVGAPKRYNYTAVGETVNVAARLESLPGDYGCRVVVGPVAAARLRDAFLLNELDLVRVKGKEEAIAVYELVCAEADITDAECSYVARYAAALAEYRAGRFAEAEAAWSGLAAPRDGAGGPPAVMARRAASLHRDPPAGPWDGIWVRTSK